MHKRPYSRHGFSIRLYVKDAVATTVMTRIESSGVTSKFLSPSSRCRGPDLQPNPDGQDDQDDRRDHCRHGKRSSEAPHGCTSNGSALTAAASRPRYCIRSANFARWSGIVGSSLDCSGGRPLLGLGGRKLIRQKNREAGVYSASRDRRF